jgi:hypothetical protein
MEIIITGKNKVITKKEIRYALSFFGNILLGKRLAKNIYLELYNCDFDLNDMGFCSPTDWDYRNHRDFEILLNRALAKEEQLATLAHEMVHIKQYARKELKMCKGDYYKWMGKKMYLPSDKFDKKYKDGRLPWETEACLSEEWLLDFYKKHCERNKLEWKTK